MRTVVLVLLLCLCHASIYASVSEKKYQRKIPKKGFEELVISNKYGRIEVEQSTGNQIEVSVRIVATAKTDAKADEMLDLVTIRETYAGNALNFETDIAKDIALTQLLAGTTVNIDYTVVVPEGMRLRLINTNGNVMMTDFVGEVNVDIKSGSFTANSVKEGELYIKQEGGSFEIADVGVMSGEFKSCEMKIENAERVKLVTTSSSGLLGKIEKLNIRSFGGSISLGEIEEMSGSSSYTKYEVQDIGSMLNMDMKWGEINVRNIHTDFSEVNITGFFTKVGLTFMDDAGYHLEIRYNKSLKMELPCDMVLDERPTPKKNVMVASKTVGNPKYGGKVILNLSNGSLYIQ